MSEFRGEKWRTAMHADAVKLEEAGMGALAKWRHAAVWADAKAEARVQRARERLTA